MPADLRTITSPADRPLLARFYDEVYRPAFAHQCEPLASWERQLWGDARGYRQLIVIAGIELDDASCARIDGGILCERYPLSACGLLTYLVVAPDARHAGLGRSLLDRACRALADDARAAGDSLRAVFGEVSDPDRSSDADDAARLLRFQRWGARVIDVRYVQPSLGPGYPRDRSLRLIQFFDGPPPTAIDGAIVTDFLREFYAVTEGHHAATDLELGAIIDAVPAVVSAVAWRAG
jgi:GNAT superfamily N-acetyltransferase